MRRRRGKSQQNDGVIAIADGRIPMIALVQALAVAQYLSFRRAAAALGVSQSSISKHICRLESDLGTLLFDRSTQGTRPTQAGRLFIDQVENAIGILDLAVKTAAMRARGNEGELCIGIHALVAGGFLDRLLERYHRDHPNVLLHITEGTARETQIMVRGDHLDVAFMPDHQDIHDLHSRVFWRDRLMAVVPVGHRLATQEHIEWKDLSGETFIVREGGTGPQICDLIVVRSTGRWLIPTIVRHNVGRDSLMSIVAKGHGISLLVHEHAALAPPGVVFRPIFDETETVAFSAVWSPRNRSPTLRNLLELAGRMARAHRIP